MNEELEKILEESTKTMKDSLQYVVKSGIIKEFASYINALYNEYCKYFDDDRAWDMVKETYKLLIPKINLIWMTHLIINKNIFKTKRILYTNAICINTHKQGLHL